MVRKTPMREVPGSSIVCRGNLPGLRANSS